MKKRLLLVLTIVMLMCIAAFSANAATCAKGEHTVNNNYVCTTCGKSNWCAPLDHTKSTKVVAPTCTEQGCTVEYCADCGLTLTKVNLTSALGHLWENDYKEYGAYYQNNRKCVRAGCNHSEIEKDANGYDVKYFLVSFINAKAMDERLTEIYIDGHEVTMNHTVLAKTTKHEGLYSDYVKEGNSITYKGVKPTRVKDINIGKYTFIGWTLDKSKDTTDTCDYEGLEVTVTATSNATYYAVWRPENVIYSIQFMNSNGESWISADNKEVQVKHGDTLFYKWEYPTRKSSVAFDYEFSGWGVGKKTASGETYDEYLLSNGVHLKQIPIVSGDTIVAIHEELPRAYKAEIDLKNGTVIKENIYYGTKLELEKHGDDYNFTFNSNGTVYNIPGTYSDETYTYLFGSSFKALTKPEHSISNTFTVPKYTIDNNDKVYLENYETGERVTVNGKDMLFSDEHGSYSYNFFDYFKEEREYYNYCLNNTVLYEYKYFDLNKTTYLCLVTEHGDYVYENGDKIIIEVSMSGIYKFNLVTNGREKFTEADADALRVIKVEPVYRSIVRKYPFIVEVVMPVEINGEKIEDKPFSYNNNIAVQVQNQNGKLVASGKTGNHKDYQAVEFKEKGNKYVKFFCVLSVEKADYYEISVATTDAKEKFEGGRTIYWSTYASSYDEKTNTRTPNIVVDLSVSADYNNGLNCSCLCHGILKGLWARILNILNSLFKMKHVCCPHMYAEIGEMLNY